MKRLEKRSLFHKGEELKDLSIVIMPQNRFCARNVFQNNIPGR